MGFGRRFASFSIDLTLVYQARAGGISLQLSAVGPRNIPGLRLLNALPVVTKPAIADAKEYLRLRA
jgi:hypothetical protein